MRDPIETFLSIPAGARDKLKLQHPKRLAFRPWRSRGRTDNGLANKVYNVKIKHGETVFRRE
jgi:hypothetical protein